jgi:nicotinamide-nucleotide amidase
MDIIKQLHDLCIAENISISVAESCTSGLIASKITSISGSSAYFKGGIIAYQNEIKVNFLGVSQRLIDEKTEVSSEVVEQMALNVQDKFYSDFSVATSGYAGPLGGTEKNPVGTVFIAIAIQSEVTSSKFYFSGSREGVVNQATDESLRMLIEKIKKEE